MLGNSFADKALMAACIFTSFSRILGLLGFPMYCLRDEHGGDRENA
jgi:hypothetical protein